MYRPMKTTVAREKSTLSKQDRDVLSGKELPRARANKTVAKMTQREINKDGLRKTSKSADKRRRHDSPLFSTRGPGQAPKVKGDLDVAQAGE